ncbi:MAG: 30S ribosomal protein S4 [Planctomycetes bacterium]|nr:30S ribosomal protein S4 [Planctomycetota bacterium]
MSRYIGPKGRINRRLGDLILENSGAIKALNRRPVPPGAHGQGRHKLSEYGEGLREKQKVRYFYGLTDRQIRNLFQKAAQLKGNTGENLMVLLERRVDNIVRVAGFARTRAQARQFVTHGHWYLNGRRIDVPSIILKAGDELKVRSRNRNVYENLIGTSETTPRGWLEVNHAERTIKVLALPSFDDCSLRVDMNKMIEFLAR